jgi:hypothetical protein
MVPPVRGSTEARLVALVVAGDTFSGVGAVGSATWGSAPGSESAASPSSPLAAQEITKSKPNLKNRAAPEVEAAVVQLGIDEPAPPRPPGRGPFGIGSAGLLAADGARPAPPTS